MVEPPIISDHLKCQAKVVAYRRWLLTRASDHIGSKFCLTSIRWLKRFIPVLNALVTHKNTILRKKCVTSH